MKKRILSILLVIVMVLALTACVENTDAHLETSQLVPVATTEDTTEAAISIPTTVLPEKFLWVDEIWAMSSDEISTYLADLVYISESKSLSSEEMFQLGNYFQNIWWYKEVSSNGEFDFNMEEYAVQSYVAFINVHNQAIKQNIPLNELYSWTWIPVDDVLCMYFSSENFSETIDISCKEFYALSEEDALRVAEAVFENPVFATNFEVAVDALYNPCTEVQEMAWEHLASISKSSDLELSRHTEYICDYILGKVLDDKDEEQLIEISRNIIENPNYDFVAKYTCFINRNLDDNIRNLALENLLELAANADMEAYEQIKQVAEAIYDTEVANKLLDALGN